MPSAVRLREDDSAEELRGLARRSRAVSQSRGLLSLAGVRDGMDRGAAAKIGGMDRQTLRDWVHRFNASGAGGLLDDWTEGPKPRLSSAQMAEVARIVGAGPFGFALRRHRHDAASPRRNLTQMWPTAPTPSCGSLEPDGPQHAISTLPKPSRRSSCPHARRSSIRSRTSGSTCVKPGSPTATRLLAIRELNSGGLRGRR